MNRINSKKSQVTIFIILAIIIISVVILIYFLRPKQEMLIIDEKDPLNFITSCINNELKSMIITLENQGGDLVLENFASYKGYNLTYLCYNTNVYKTCINQRPLLTEHLTSQINNKIRDIAENCFLNYKKFFEKKSLMELGEMNISTTISKDQVIVDIKRELIITIEKNTLKYESFKIILKSDLYDLAVLAMEIVNQEAKYCNFNHLGYMILYPEYDIDKDRVSYNENKGFSVYTINKRNSKEIFRFAVRSCKMPPGF
jgi:hypothetical protein